MPTAKTLSSPLRSTIKNSARRCLFSQPPNAEPNDQFVKRLLNELHENYKAKWQFDFVTDTPLEIKNSKKHYIYEKMNEKNVPGFYRASTYLPIYSSNSYLDPCLSTPTSKQNLIDDNLFESENIDPKKLKCNRQVSTLRLLNNNLENYDENFNDKKLLNEVTSSSLSENECEFSTSFNSSATDFNVSDMSETSELIEKSNCENYILNNSSLLSSSAKNSAVTPKKQTKLTDFLTQRRKTLQRSAKKNDLCFYNLSKTTPRRNKVQYRKINFSELTEEYFDTPVKRLCLNRELN